MNYTNLYIECLDKIKILLDGKSNKEYEELKKIGKESDILDMSNTIFRCKNLIKELQLINVKDTEIVYVEVPVPVHISVPIPEPIPEPVAEPTQNPVKEDCPIKILSEAVKKYYDKLRTNLNIFVQNTIDRHLVTPPTVGMPTITFCNSPQTDIQIIYKPKRHIRHTPIINITTVTDINGVIDDATAKYYLIFYLMKEKQQFITTLIQFLLKVCSDIKYNYIENYYIFLPEVRHFEFINIKSPDTEQLSLLDMLTYICTRKIAFYDYIFDFNDYTREFKEIVCNRSNVFVDLFTKLILSNTINISIINPIFDLNEYLKFLKTNTITSLVEYSQIMNFIRLDFNELLTTTLAEDFPKSTKMVEHFLTTFNANPHTNIELLVKGGNLFKLNLIEFMKDTRYKNTDLYKKYKGKPIKLSDWDFSAKLSCKNSLNYYQNCYNNVLAEINHIFREFRTSYETELLTHRNFIYNTAIQYIKDCDAQLIEITKSSGYDTKTFYSTDFNNNVTYQNFNIDDTLNNIKDPDLLNTALMNYRIITKLDNIQTKFKITNIEIIPYLESGQTNGFDLSRINIKYGITIKLGNNCIKFRSHAELIDFGTDKIGTRKYRNRPENMPSIHAVDQARMYGNVVLNNKQIPSYSMLWFIDDIVGIYMEEATAKDVKRYDRLIDALYMLYHTNIADFQRLHTIRKPTGKTILEHIIEIYDNMSNSDKNIYTKDIIFIKNVFGLPP